MKGVIRPDHIPKNKFKVIFSGLPDLTAVRCTGIEEELDAVDLPDRTKASGGRTKPVEFTIAIPTHHTEEIQAMDAWWESCAGDVQPSYKKTGSIVKMSLSATLTKTLSLVGVFITSRNNAELDMNDDGEEDEVEYVMSADDVMSR